MIWLDDTDRKRLKLLILATTRKPFCKPISLSIAGSRQLILALLATLCGASSAIPNNADASNLEACRTLQPEHNNRLITISNPGTYCLDQDYTVSCPKFFSFGESCYGFGLRIRASNVTIDLRGHTIGGSAGVSITGIGSSIAVRNGRLKNGLIMLSNAEAGSVRSWGSIDRRDGAARPTDTFYTLENLHFESTAKILLAGGKNRIRNNTFDVDLDNRLDQTTNTGVASSDSAPQALLLNYGPSASIENNKVTQKSNSRKLRPTYAVLLKVGDHSTVRGNVFAFAGDTRRTAAIGLVDSQSVRVEDNTYLGVDAEAELRNLGNSSTSRGSFIN